MSRRHLLIGLISAVVIQHAAAAFAQDTRVEDLEQQLRERDKVMLELLDRIEALENRVGVRRVRRDKAAPGQSDASGKTAQIPGPAPRQAPGTIMVDARLAERALERSLSREGALLLPSGTLEIEPGFSFARAEDRINTLVLSGGGVVAGETEVNTNRFSADMALRLGLPWDSQLEIGIPYRTAQVETITKVGFAPTGSASRWGSGFGDLRVGFAKTLLRENLWRPDLVGRITWNTDTGPGGSNGVSLGGGFNEVQGSLTAIKRQDPVVFIGSLSWQHSFEKDQIQPGSVHGLNLGAAWALSPETSLRFFLSGAWQGEVEQFGTPIEGSSRTSATFVIGGSALLAPGILLNTSLGIGLTDDADDFSLTFSLPIRFRTPLF